MVDIGEETTLHKADVRYFTSLTVLESGVVRSEYLSHIGHHKIEHIFLFSSFTLPLFISASIFPLYHYRSLGVSAFHIW